MDHGILRNLALRPSLRRGHRRFDFEGGGRTRGNMTPPTQNAQNKNIGGHVTKRPQLKSRSEPRARAHGARGLSEL